MFTDPLQHIDQVGVRIDAAQPAGDDQALDDADVFRAEFGPTEEPSFATHWHDAQCPLQVVRVNGDIRVGEKDFETDASLAHIVQGLYKRVGRGGAFPRELSTAAWK